MKHICYICLNLALLAICDAFAITNYMNSATTAAHVNIVVVFLITTFSFPPFTKIKS